MDSNAPIALTVMSGTEGLHLLLTDGLSRRVFFWLHCNCNHINVGLIGPRSYRIRQNDAK